MHGIVEKLMRAHRFKWTGEKIVKQEMIEILLVAMRQVIMMIEQQNCLLSVT